MWIGFLDSGERNAFTHGIVWFILGQGKRKPLSSRDVFLLFPDKFFLFFFLFVWFRLFVCVCVSSLNHACFALILLLSILFTEFKDGVFSFLIHYLSLASN